MDPTSLKQWLRNRGVEESRIEDAERHCCINAAWGLNPFDEVSNMPRSGPKWTPLRLLSPPKVASEPVAGVRFAPNATVPRALV